MEIDLKLAGARIRAVRNARNMTARKVANEVGIAEESLLHIESGVRSTSLHTFYRIAVVLDASMDYLSGRTDNPNERIATPIIRSEGLSGKQENAMMDISKAVASIIKKYV